MKILITGTEGYIGSLLAPLLMHRGHQVIGVDSGFYKVGWLYNGARLTPLTLVKDIRHIDVNDLEGVNAVVHLAELSNDPLGQLAPEITYEINHQASVRLAELAKTASVERFVYSSSCSVYGVATEECVTEESSINPQTAYAECKTFVERDVGKLADDRFSPTFLRNATAYGASPRMRFDLVLNNLAGLAWSTGTIAMTSDGTPWRPLIHVLDICKAFVCTVEASRNIVHGQIFNVGDTEANYQVKAVAETIAEVFQGCRLTFGSNPADKRSYRVSFEKIHRSLPDFQCEWNPLRGAQQLYTLFQKIDMTEEMFFSKDFTRLKQIEYLIRTKQIDEKFFWRDS